VVTGRYVSQLCTFIVTTAALRRFSTTPMTTPPAAANKPHLLRSMSGMSRTARGAKRPTTISSQNQRALKLHWPRFYGPVRLSVKIKKDAPRHPSRPALGRLQRTSRRTPDLRDVAARA
jgi:hypothetical protein